VGKINKSGWFTVYICNLSGNTFFMQDNEWVNMFVDLMMDIPYRKWTAEMKNPNGDGCFEC